MKRAKTVSLIAKIFLVLTAIANVGVVVVLCMTADFTTVPDEIELIIASACNVVMPVLLCYMIKGDPFAKSKVWTDESPDPEKMMFQRVVAMIFLAVADSVLLLITLLPPLVTARLIAFLVAAAVSLPAFVMLFVTLKLYRIEHNKKTAEQSAAK